MEYEPISVALKFGFLAVLYLFLLFIARSALKDLRRTANPAPDSTTQTTASGCLRTIAATQNRRRKRNRPMAGLPYARH